MTSGQWTMGARTKVNLCRPVEIVSPSFTTMQRSVTLALKNWPIMEMALALATTWALGWVRSTAPRVEQWSGSIWFTTT